MWRYARSIEPDGNSEDGNRHGHRCGTVRIILNNWDPSVSLYEYGKYLK